MKLLLGLFLLVSAVTAYSVLNATVPARKSYLGYQVHRLVPQNEAQLKALRSLEETNSEFDFWTGPSFVQREVHVMVPPVQKEAFQKFLNQQGLADQIWIEDVQSRIDGERVNRSGKPRAPEDFGWEDYHKLEEIYEWLDWMVAQHPDVLTAVVGGTSHEEREIRGVKLSFGADKKGVFIECGIHAREWIGPATVTYILNEFISSTDEEVRALAESRDWYFFPSVNPDGYVYSHTNDRMWRKTRKPYGNGNFGADPNRNWDYHWLEGGASSDPTSETFGGSSAFSEIETKTLSEYITTVADTLDAYIAIHSFSQYILIPFGHQGLEVPENQEELLRVGVAAANALYKYRYGTRYIVGNIPNTIYVASGGSIDWVKGVHRNVRLVYAYELRDTGEHGFVLPPEQIVPTAEETLASLIGMFKEAGEPADPTQNPPTQNPPTQNPPTQNPPTQNPPTNAPSTPQPPTQQPPTTPDGAVSVSSSLLLTTIVALYTLL